MEERTAQFIEIFGQSQEHLRTFFAPGRVNMIGEHIDYNGGHVLPVALEIGTYAIARKRDDKKLKLYSSNFSDKGTIEADLENLSYKKDQDWANFPIGIFEYMQKERGFDYGLDIFFEGNIPNGAGLSSSASIELVTAVLVNEIYQLGVSTLELVKLSQTVENQFIGVNCGIMDQFAVGFGQEGHAILLDCQTLDYRYTPFELADSAIVIANTNKKRGLADSAYNERRSTCETALEKLQQELPISYLADMSPEQFEEHKGLLTEEEEKRVRHVVTENHRTVKAIEILEQGNLEEFGKLMKASHVSLRDDYEVSGKELDALAEAAWEQEGTIGARMTGAGFGGCTVNIVKNEDVNAFIEQVGKKYKDKIGYEATFYIVNAGGGAREITALQE